MSYPPTEQDGRAEQGWSGPGDETVAPSRDDPAAGAGHEQPGRGQERSGWPSYQQDEPQTAARAGHGGAATPGWPPPTNTKAIIALCTVFGMPVLGIVFGVMARREIDRTGEAGRAYATWGLGLGIAAVAFWVLYFLAFIGFFLVTGLGVLGATSGFGSTGSSF